jgi:hypothetical protein
MYSSSPPPWLRRFQSGVRCRRRKGVHLIAFNPEQTICNGGKMRFVLRATAAIGLLACSLYGSMTSYGQTVPLALAKPALGQEAAPISGDGLQKIVARIRKEPSANTRIKYTSELVRRISASQPQYLSDNDIYAVATLLADPDDEVRGSIAGALGKLGPRARLAMPALTQALQQRPCENTPTASAAVIRLAIRRIGGVMPNMPCTDPFASEEPISPRL